MLQLGSLPLLLLPPLPLRTIIQQESQRATKRENNQALKNIAIDVIAIVAVAAVDVVFIIIWLVVVPTSEFGFEESGEPLGEGEVFLDTCGGLASSNRVGRRRDSLLGSS